ncbi:MAG: response regulator [Propionivibrio sp.]
MDSEYTIFVVDDMEAGRRMIEMTFKPLYNVESFASGQACLDRIAEKVPDLLLLDVDMPVMNGYTLCQLIKCQPALSSLPVIFISVLDDLASCIAGYEAGGDDYIVKPYQVAELRKKVVAARRKSNDSAQLKIKTVEAKLLSSLALSNMDQQAVLITFLRQLNDCETPSALLQALFSLMRSSGLQTAIQIRLPDLEITSNEAGESLPLEVAVINNMRSMERIVEFKSRAAYNFEHITILINNVPIHDPDLCGILRDNVAIAAECANAKLQALQTKSENTMAKGVAADLLSSLQTAVQNFENKYATARYHATSTTLIVLGELSRAFTTLGMSDKQEKCVDTIVQNMANDLAEIYNFSGETQETLSGIARRLTSILNTEKATATAGRDIEPEPAGRGCC